jgi:hypothetical protein
MSVQAQERTRERRPQLKKVEEVFDDMDLLIERNAELESDNDSLQQQVALMTAEINQLRKEGSQLQRSRDHYFRSHSAITAGLEDIAALFLEHIRKARNHDYGGRGQTNATEIAKEVAEVRLPQFLHKGPRLAEETDGKRGAATLRVLAEALDGSPAR